MFIDGLEDFVDFEIQRGSTIPNKITITATKPLKSIEWDWTLIRRSISALRSGLKVVRAAIPTGLDPLTNSIQVLGLISGFNVPRCYQRIQSSANDFFLGVSYRDVFLTMHTVAEMPTVIGEGAESSLIVSSCLHNLCDAVPFPAEVAAKMLPLALTLTTASITLNAMEFYQTRHIVKTLNDPTALKVDDLWKSKIKRYISPRLTGSEEREQLITLAQKRMSIICANSMANAISLFALRLIAAGAVAPVIPLGLLSAVSVARIFIYLYETR